MWQYKEFYMDLGEFHQVFDNYDFMGCCSSKLPWCKLRFHNCDALICIDISHIRGYFQV